MGDSKAFNLKTRVCHFIGELAANEEGQAVTEYIIILSAVVVASVTLTRSILKGINKGILTMGAVLEKDLKTGRVNASNWKN